MTPSLLRMAGDERLARMVTSGNDGAFAALYDRYHDVLVRYCRSLLRDDQDALDAFQSTMLNALRALRDDRRRAPVRPWLFRIAHNESISVLRRRPAAEPLDDRQVATVDVHRTAEDREALAGLLEDLTSLTAHQRGALLLRELGGLTYDDVALVLDTTPLAARQAVFAARASLHDQREGRELPCPMVQRRLSDGDRRASRTRAVRAHLRGCDDCRGFANAIGRRRRAAVLLPVPPAFASSGLLTSILDAGSGGAASVGGGAVATGLVAKAAVALSAAVVATGAAEPDRTTGARATASAAPRAATKKATTTRAVTRTTKATTTTTVTTTASAPKPAQPARAATPAKKTTTSTSHSAPQHDHTTTTATPSFGEQHAEPVRLAAEDDHDAAPHRWSGGHRDDRIDGDAPSSGPVVAGRARQPDAPTPEAAPPSAPPATTAAPSDAIPPPSG